MHYLKADASSIVCSTLAGCRSKIRDVNLDKYWSGSNLVLKVRGTKAFYGASNNASSTLDEVATKSNVLGKATCGHS